MRTFTFRRILTGISCSRFGNAFPILGRLSLSRIFTRLNSFKRNPTHTLSEQYRASKNEHHRTVLYALVAAIACFAAGADFMAQRRPEPIHPSFALTTAKRLSDYLPSLRGSEGESDLYIFEGKEPGGTMLVLGGTHPNEPAGFLAAVLLVENLQVQKGRVIVLPRANASAFTATEPQEAFPGTIEIPNRLGKPRTFRIGSRFTNILDGWPDPIICRHYPSGQLLSGNETRNLNRAYPGRVNGTLTERIAYAITEVVKQEKVGLVIDLHEAAPEYPVINALVAHDRAMDIAGLAAVDLQIEGLDFRLEPSPANFHGLIHREIGDFTNSRVMLFETAGALQGRLRGATDAELVLKSNDPLYVRAAELGKLQVPFPKEGIPLEVRVGRHLQAILSVCGVMREMDTENSVEFSRIPNYAELQQHGVGFYLQ